MDKINIAAFSDTHGSTPLIKELDESIDLLLICGDISPCRGDHSFEAQTNYFKNISI